VHGIEIRPATPDDEPAILRLAQASHGWGRDAIHAEFFRWKHFANPLGASPMWIAVDGDRLAGFRVFLRWKFETPDGVVPAVRAVDTATSPDYQGRGVFTSLTLYALERLREQGVGFVFNTPNSQSLPGYLKMGWREVGRVPIAVRPMSLTALVRMVRSRVPAERWSLATGVGFPAPDILSDPDLAALLDTQPRAERLRTHWTPEFLRWRYAFAQLNYRCFLLGSGVTDGVAVLRLRPRGTAVEAVLCDVIVPWGDERTATRLVRRAVDALEADYVIRVSPRAFARGGFLRLPRSGPVLVHRSVRAQGGSTMADWALTLGDVELF
jgi:GNAT superfamily N-acetyltransferase